MKLDLSFYSRPTLIVAEEMLGKYLIFYNHSFRITETEAYLDATDLASHARFKSRKRNHLMFGRAGILYVYFTYGMHYMLNIVAKEENSAGAVLIRALENCSEEKQDLSGPGKLTKVLKITQNHNGLEATGPLFYLEDRKNTIGTIEKTPRIGIDYAGAYKDKPWRFKLVC